MSRFVDNEGRAWYDKGDILRHRTFGWICRYEEVVITNARRHFVTRRLTDGRRIVLPDNEWEEYKEE